MALPTTVLTVLIADTKQFQAEMAKADATMAKFGATGDAAGSRFSTFANKASTAVIGVGLAVGAVAVKLAYDYNAAIDKVGLQSNLTSVQLEQLRRTALSVSTATATSAKTIADAYLVTSKAGFSVAQSSVAVAQAAKFANAESGNLNATLSAAITIQKAGIAGTKSVSQTIDIFTNAVRHSRLAADDLTAAFTGRAASAFAAFGIHLQDAVTLLAGFANVGLTGQRSLMAIKTGLAALDAPMVSSAGKFSTTAKTLAQMGLNQETLAAETKRPGGLLDVLKQMDLAWQKNATGAQRAQGVVSFFDQIFGKTAGPAFTLLMQQLQSGKLKGLIDSVNTPGSTNNVFATWLKSPTGAIRNFVTTLENTAIKLGDVLLPKLTVGLIDATRLVTDIFGTPQHPNNAGIGIAEAVGGSLLGGAIAVKLVRGILTVARGFGVGGAAAEGAAGASEIAAAAGGITAAGIASFLGTTEILKHNLFGLGAAVDEVTGMILGPTKVGTTAEAGNLARLLKGYGITPGNATIGLSPATLAWMKANIGVIGRPSGTGPRGGAPHKVTVTTKTYFHK